MGTSVCVCASLPLSLSTPSLPLSLSSSLPLGLSASLPLSLSPSLPLSLSPSLRHSPSSLHAAVMCSSAPQSTWREGVGEHSRARHRHRVVARPGGPWAPALLRHRGGRGCAARRRRALGRGSGAMVRRFSMTSRRLSCGFRGCSRVSQLFSRGRRSGAVIWRAILLPGAGDAARHRPLAQGLREASPATMYFCYFSCR